MATYEGSEQQKYYLKNKDFTLEKLRNKTAANKVAREAAKIEKEIIKQNNIIKINNMGKNIYEHILEKEYFNKTSDIIDYLNDIIEQQYYLGGMTYLKILIDYMALNDIQFNKRAYPWSTIENKYGMSIKISINQRKKYYNIK